jgi:hypothetical protein
MGDVVTIYSGPSGERKQEGKAEIKEVVKYLGGGRYVVKCVFQGDKREQERVIDIAERHGAQEAAKR